MIANGRPVEQRLTHRPIWHIAVPTLALLFMLFQFVMPPPPRDPMIVFAAAMAPISAQTHAPDTCPPGDHCPGIVVEQALPRLPVPPLLLLALVVVVFAVRWEPRVLIARHTWWWPPDRRRALLQVFLI